MCEENPPSHPTVLGGLDNAVPLVKRLTDKAMFHVASDDLPNEHIPAHGYRTPIQSMSLVQQRKVAPEGSGVPVLDHLLNWAIKRRSTPMFALLGDYGMGKTVNCKRLTLALLELRKQSRMAEQPAPMPVYLDLRYARGLFRNETPPTGQPAFRACRLDDLVDTIFHESWRTHEKPDASDLRRLVSGGNVLIIFDGFDEVAVHLHPEEAQSLIRTMWSLLPRDALSPDVERRPFRSGVGADAYQLPDPLLPGRNAAGKPFHRLPAGLENGAGLYDAITLLPFEDVQIERFLTGKLHDTKAARRALETMRDVHTFPS